MSKFDSRTTMYSPEGRLYQIEYALEAISHAGTCLGITAKDGILLCAEKKNVARLLDQSTGPEKIFKLDDHVACSVAGITADANILIDYLRLSAQRYLLTYQEPVPIEELVTLVCDVKQQYTQIGGLRPFGTSILFMGYDKHYGFQLYQSDPSGNFGGWMATCIGANAQAAESILKQDYKEGCTLKEALLLAVKLLNKTMDSTSLTSDKLEFATLTLQQGKPHFSVLKPEQVTALLKEGEDIRKAEEEAERKKKEERARERKAAGKPE